MAILFIVFILFSLHALRLPRHCVFSFLPIVSDSPDWSSLPESLARGKLGYSNKDTTFAARSSQQGCLHSHPHQHSLPAPPPELQNWGTQVSGDAPSLWLHCINALARDLGVSSLLLTLRKNFWLPKKAHFLLWHKHKPATYRCWNYKVWLWTKDTVVASLPMRH